MPSALSLRTDYSPADLPLLAKKTKSNNQSRRLLSLTAVLDGMNRTDAARIAGSAVGLDAELLGTVLLSQNIA